MFISSNKTGLAIGFLLGSALIAEGNAAKDFIGF
jgi:hypothetical protein